ncbi:tRNA (adenosine(37)-N6)-threonylcarbamoyltransferase complex ATPase subunit type 1 TsaE [Actinomyces sp. ZJ308]|uniref:tRNA (adenosine(37)-N6)-threonylcarbamoyltransferase complex ATPase subunit type 1 TsaE n=1 Tax=Actinomyces sp. ZJ308 TaxID=2708342 RepID=UPI001420AB87|nr:tRNA (adenosine(37)-N6)-threonylcarbamoyltransferase complex ATPase subunit type 1 TsaE [Actinomyces sp. ZJ308]
MSGAPHTPEAVPEITVATGDADETRGLGARLAHLLRAGDLVMLSGGLGAGKTTLAQGIGAALGVRGRVSSPTFIIARVHPSLSDGPDLIHVDAYRITSLEEIDALDLDSSLDRSVTLVEWGEEKVEALSPDRLEIQVLRPHGAVRAGAPRLDDVRADSQRSAGSATEGPVVDLGEVDDGNRTITVRALGPRWADVDLGPLGTGASHRQSGAPL